MPIPTRLTAFRCGWLVFAAVVNICIVPLWGFGPDVLGVIVAAIALHAGSSAGALAGLAGGWLIDLLPPGAEQLGSHAVIYALAGALVGIFGTASRASVLLPAVAAGAAASTVQCIFGILSLSAQQTMSLNALAEAVVVIVTTSVLGMCLIPPLLHHGRRLVQRGRG